MTTTIIMLAILIVNLLCSLYSIYRYRKIEKKMNIVFNGIDDFYEQERNKYSDNGKNLDFMQKAIDLLNEAGNEPSITVDENGHRWISVEISKYNSVNIIRLDDKNFGRHAKWEDIEAIIKNANEVEIPKIRESISSTYAKNGSEEEKGEK